MKFKKFTCLLLFICILFSFSACTVPEEKTKKQEENVETITPLLYKVTDEEGHVVWLFGSIHVGEEDFYPLPDYVYDAYDSADSLAVECDIIAFEDDIKAQTEALSMMVYTDGSTIENYISEDVYERAVEIIDAGDNYMKAYDYYYPVVWSDLIDSFLYEKLEYDFDLGIDRHLLNRAYDEEKEILEVESVEFQYGMMAGFSMELQTMLLESSVESYDDYKETEKNIKELVDAWKKGDEDKLAEIASDETEEFTAQEEVLYKEYQEAMITSRNISMADYAENALKAGKEVFICVGAAHVVGDNAMVDLLQERGYTVEIIKE